MRLFKRPDSPSWYVEIKRGHSYSLKTSDETEARLVFLELEKENLRNKLHALEQQGGLSVSSWKNQYIKGRNDKSANTTRADELALRLFGDVVGHDFPIKHIAAKHIGDFVSVCSARGLKPRAVNVYLRHIKAALGEAVRQGRMNALPRIKMLKEPKRLPAFFRRDEVSRIVEHLKANDPGLYHICLFALWTGARREEISTLRWEHISGEWCRIIGKGDKERWVPLVDGAKAAIGDAGKGLIFSGIHKDTISHRFKDVLTKIGIEGNFHKLRHTAATFMLENGIPLPVIQKILGHASIQTTQIYAEVQNKMLEKEMQKLTL